MSESAEFFHAAGVLARHIPDFAPRAEQQTLAAAVDEALRERATLIAEAGTGTGKTFAYLAPALAAGLKTLISTGTRNLQDQLFQRDVPIVKAALGTARKIAILKGRTNYLCRYRLTRMREQELFDHASEAGELAEITRWARATRHGELAELASVSEGSPLWPRLTATAETCLGQECPDFERCFVVAARRRAQEADLVVVNHHLLLADMLLKEDGFGTLLPEAEAVIVDEAHQLPGVAAHYFGVMLSSRQLTDWARDAAAECRTGAGDVPQLPPLLAAAETAIEAVREALGAQHERKAWQASEQPKAQLPLQDLQQTLQDAVGGLAAVAERSRGLANCWQRAREHLQRLELFLNEDAEEESVRWYECRGRGFILHVSPLEISTRFEAHREASETAWIFTSATLTVAGSFSHFRARLGLTGGRELLLSSPFDYTHNAMLYLPRALPAVNANEYTQAVVEAALPVLRASYGRAFFLFTSYRALRTAATLLRGRIEHPLLVQGEMARSRLIERFRALGNAVLLGTASFWEGVDVRGPALSVVIIDRLPFAAPGDPVLAARLEALRRRGENPFMDYQLPQAVIALKQGVGRLIRDHNDQGVMMLCDPRLLGRGYGKIFLNSLPSMQRTRSLEEVEHFLAQLDDAATKAS